MLIDGKEMELIEHHITPDNGASIKVHLAISEAIWNGKKAAQELIDGHKDEI